MSKLIYNLGIVVLSPFALIATIMILVGDGIFGIIHISERILAKVFRV